MMGAWTPWLAGATVVVCVVVGWALAVLTLPGVWLMLLAASLVNWLWTPGVYSWWTIGVCAAVALVGEVLEVVASGFGSKKFGGTKTGAAGSVIGGLVGGVVGTFAIPVPIVGTIVGSVVGAAVGALAAEKGIKKRTWKESHKSAAGAAAGRLAATVIKLAVAVGVGLVLLVGLVTGL
jgi:uncharacterized protein YqgC (DUF456 family)